MEIHVNLHLILYVGGVTLTKREVSLHAGEWMKKKSFWCIYIYIYSTALMQFLLAFWIGVVVDIHTTTAAAAVLDGGLSFVPWICFSVKVNEQNKEAHFVKTDPYVECFGEIAFVLKEELEAMSRSYDELCDLEGSQVFLPPGIFFESGTHGC